jgi:hypothetical protein
LPSSTITLEYCFDTIATKGVPDPRGQASGYGDTLAQELGSEVMADLLAGAVNARGEVTRFNWKFNRGFTSFQLNSWQQDYPLPAQPGGIIAWGEECDILDINNTQVPKPLNWDGAVTFKRQLPRTTLSRWRPLNVCWMYNSTLSFGTWPGVHVVYSPLNGASPSNPVMSMIDANGNLLIVSGFGTTGLTAPLLTANSPEGTTVLDGSVTWKVVSPTSQGFRVDWIPNQTSPNYQLIPYFQFEPPTFKFLGQTLSPVPDSFSRHFMTGLEAAMYKASRNPGDANRGMKAHGDWLASLLVMTGQANKEPDAYSMIPITQPVERRWQDDGPYTADRPV